MEFCQFPCEPFQIMDLFNVLSVSFIVHYPEESYSATLFLAQLGALRNHLRHDGTVPFLVVSWHCASSRYGGALQWPYQNCSVCEPS